MCYKISRYHFAKEGKFLSLLLFFYYFSKPFTGLQRSTADHYSFILRSSFDASLLQKDRFRQKLQQIRGANC